MFHIVNLIESKEDPTATIQSPLSATGEGIVEGTPIHHDTPVCPDGRESKEANRIPDFIRRARREARQQRHLERERASLVGLPAEEAAEIAEDIGDSPVEGSERKEDPPLESAPETMYPAWDEFGKAMLPSCGAGQEIVVDRWHILGSGYMVIDRFDYCLLSYKLSNGNIVQNKYRYIRVGEKVDFRHGPFARSIDRNYDDLPHFPDLDGYSVIRKFAGTIVSEALGKNDLPLVYLTQRLAGIIIAAGIPKWETMIPEIHSYLQSEEFLIRLENYHINRTEHAEQVFKIKARKYVNQNVDLVRKGEEYVERLINVRPMSFAYVFETFFFFFVWAFFAYFLLFWVDYNFHFTAFVILVVMEREKLRAFLFDFTHRNWNMNEKVTLNYAAVLNVRQRCSQGIDLPPVMDGVTLTSKKDLRVECDTTNKLIPVYGSVLKGHPYIIPTTCFHNLYNGLRIRFCFDRQYNKRAIDSLVASSIDFMKSEKLRKFTGQEQDEWINKFPTKRRLQLIEAKEQGFVVDPVADLFVKREAYVGKHDKFKPRQIWNPKAVTMAYVGPVFAEINDYLAQKYNVHNNITIDCGLSAEDLGHKALMCSSRQRLFEMDVSSWDGSLVEEWAEFEEFLVSEMVGDEQVKAAVLSYWREKIGHGSGVRVKARHGRRSGDPWTSSFNGLINAMIVKWIFGDDADSLLICVKGDDNFVGVNSRMTVEEIVAKYASIGMTVEIKEVSLYTLGYCSGKFWPTSEGPKWGVCPFRVLAKLGINLNGHPVKVHKRLLLGTVISLLPIAGHVPLVGALFRNLVEQRTVKPLFIDDGFKYKNSSCTVHQVHPDSYCWLANYSGATVEELLLLEKTLSSLTLEDFPFVLSGEIVERIGRHMYGHEGCRDHYIVQGERPTRHLGVPTHFWYYLVSLISAVCEEIFRHSLGKFGSSILFILLEASHGNASSWILHLGVANISNFYVRLGIHLAWNSAAYYSMVSYGSVINITLRKAKFLSKVRRKAKRILRRIRECKIVIQLGKLLRLRCVVREQVSVGTSEALEGPLQAETLELGSQKWLAQEIMQSPTTPWLPQECPSLVRQEGLSLLNTGNSLVTSQAPLLLQ